MAKPDSEKKLRLQWACLAIAAVIAVWLLLAAVPFGFANGAEERGQLGDSFGLANSLFSALAFALLIVALFMQMEELSLQREELRNTTAELRKAAEAQEQTQRHLMLTAFIQGSSTLIDYYERSRQSKHGLQHWMYNSPIRGLSDDLAFAISQIDVGQPNSPGLFKEVQRRTWACEAAIERIDDFAAGGTQLSELDALLIELVDLIEKCRATMIPLEVYDALDAAFRDQMREVKAYSETLTRSYMGADTSDASSGTREATAHEFATAKAVVLTLWTALRHHPV